MAVSVSLQASVIQASATWTPTITAPTGGALLVYIAVSRSSGAVATADLTVSGLSGTWVEIFPDTYSSRRGVRSFISTNATGTGTLTVSYVGAGFQALHGSVVDVTGVDLTTPVAGLDSVNSGEFGSGTSASPVVTGSPAAGDATISYLTFETNQACAPEGGWAELYDNGEANGIRRVGIAWDSDADATPAWTWASSSGYTCHAFRLVAAAGGGAVEGAGVAALTLTATTAGFPTTQGTGAAALALTATAAGRPTTFGTATTGLALTATAAGHPTTQGDGSAALSLSATATGLRTTYGQAATALTLTATASGSSEGVEIGAGVADLTLAATASGHPTTSGTATAATTLTATASGRVTVHATAAADLTLTATADGTNADVVTGEGTAALTLTAAALGRPTTVGDATAELTLTAAAAGTVTVRGVGVATLALAAAAAGHTPDDGDTALEPTAVLVRSTWSATILPSPWTAEVQE
jgi:hypothetical protein